ncbi:MULTISPECIES: hypothetical protein [unclassified Bacillus cereus group]|uniref:hypothetical protein n=1 Tax=Bacillus cereus group TaxID=86661 RepID=UPI0022E0F961|nr:MULTISPECIES: hypothetical protein [unclassified Bacillus cereus group]MDA2681074.1 hypothetical protein [Bacillus cereus group sp. Bc029]MDA2742028.1 hypothetical protein [Bacillus cereus group sp. Bc011]HDR7969515.1 hypothetical protein [Bacillus pacificus]
MNPIVEGSRVKRKFYVGTVLEIDIENYSEPYAKVKYDGMETPIWSPIAYLTLNEGDTK